VSILELQKRFQTLGNIRTGRQVESATSKTGWRPDKLDTFRLTSRSKGLIQQCADKWGGEVEPWDNQWEVITKADTLPVVVPPQDPENMNWYELWGTSGIQRRCDGETDIIGRGPCRCKPEDRQCTATTRVNLMLPDIEGIGVWLLTSHGWNAAQEMLASVELVMSYMQRTGHLPPASLVLEQREKRIPDPRDPAKRVTAKFAVPVLRIDLAVGDVIEAPAIGPSVDPVGALPQPTHPDAEPGETVVEPTVIDITPAVEDKAWEDLYNLLEWTDTVHKKTIPNMKASIRELYRLMELTKLWEPGTLELHWLAMLKHLDQSRSHPTEIRIGDLGNKPEMGQFATLAFQRAQDRVREGTEG
jgi:hypothetical protein